MTFGGFVGLASFLSIFFHDQYGLNKVAAGTFTTSCIIAGSLIRPVGGYLADRFGGIRILTVLFLGMALFLGGVSALPPLNDLHGPAPAGHGDAWGWATGPSSSSCRSGSPGRSAS